MRRQAKAAIHKVRKMLGRQPQPVHGAKKYELPSDYLKNVGWCKGVVSGTKDERGNYTAYTLGGAIDAWGRAHRKNRPHVVPLKRAIIRITGHPMTIFWQDDQKYLSDVLKVLHQAEREILFEEE